jgi:hypothetical protein
MTIRPTKPGPWDREPDADHWIDADTGLPCNLLRGPFWAWNGYVGIEPGHPLHGLHHNDPVPQWAVDPARQRLSSDVNLDNVDVFTLLQAAVRGGGVENITFGTLIDVHGGLSWSGPLSQLKPPDYWQFGFDCGHGGDLQPSLPPLPPKTQRLFDGCIESMLGQLQPHERTAMKRMAAEQKYRTHAYAQRQCGLLARQLYALSEIADTARIAALSEGKPA